MGSDLLDALSDLQNGGIRADADKLKRDMCSQFRDYREWIREYAVNAYDAGASYCRISGWEKGDIQTIVVEDDGAGMDAKGITTFMTVYRSAKAEGAFRPIGQHGIGKLSAAAIPGQCGFMMRTSTGTEAHRLSMGSLLSAEAVEAERVEPPWERGTRFEISFPGTCGLREELSKLADVLDAYIGFVPFCVVVFVGTEGAPKQKPRRIRQHPWSPSFLRMGATRQLRLMGKSFDLLYGIGWGGVEVMQNRVLVSTEYDVLNHGCADKLALPYFTLLVDSPDFELPFGRHCLRNEEILAIPSLHLRNSLLPEYFLQVNAAFETGGEDCRVSAAEYEEMNLSLILWRYTGPEPWMRAKVFHTRNRGIVTALQILAAVEACQVVYLEGEESAGMDYSLLEPPVISAKDKPLALKALRALCEHALCDLSTADQVIEAPSSMGDYAVTDPEKAFERRLGFHKNIEEIRGKGILSLHSAREGGGESDTPSGSRSGNGKQDAFSKAVEEFLAMRWRVAHLVRVDGFAPAVDCMFQVRGTTVVLNLANAEVRRLVDISRFAPALAGHWAMSLCLAGASKLLPHVGREIREDLLMLDAFAKCAFPQEPGAAGLEEATDSQLDGFLEFLRKSMDDAGSRTGDET